MDSIVANKTILNLFVLRDGKWFLNDEKDDRISLFQIVKNHTYTEDQSIGPDPKKLCCMVTEDTLLECGNCGEKHFYICEGFRGEVYFLSFN